MAVPSPHPPTRSRGPLVLNGSLAAGLAVVLAFTLVTAPRSAPPAIAEIAPQAVQQIVQAPKEQSSKYGSAQGGAGRADQGGRLTGTKKPLTPRLLRCVGNPPRQIEDPQSPPCIPFWEGNNGGATSKGVTRDTITIAVPQAQGDPVLQDLGSFFNDRFMFYGRRLVLIDTSADQPSSTPDPANGRPQGSDPVQGQIDAATKADQQHHVFASTGSYSFGGTYYTAELARRHVIVADDQVQYSERDLVNMRPYAWQYPMALDRELAMFGRWICSRVAGLPAAHAQDPALARATRKFGAVYNQITTPHPFDPEPFRRELSRCDVQLAVEETLDFNDSQSSSREHYASIALKMQQANVSSVVCFCYWSAMQQLMAHASSTAGYHPEWLVGDYFDNETWTNRLLPTDQTKSMFGLEFKPRVISLHDDPAVWAVDEVHPGWSTSTIQYDQAMYREARLHVLYRDLLLLASGIQMAGPHLTPETFQHALLRTVFPNPDSPLQPGKVGTAGSSRSFTRDAAEFWWSPSQQSAYTGDGTGTYCYIAAGRRFTYDNPPAGGDPFFSGTCDSGRQPLG